MRSGADALVEALADLDVEVVFGLPGVHNLAAWEALSHSGIRLVGVRHEQAAAYAADGYARATGRLGVAITTTGPGAANTLGAVGEAWASRSPLLVIATDIATTLRRPGVYRGVLHETPEQHTLFGSLTKGSVLVERAEELRSATTTAGRLATALPTRPVYLQVPTDLLAAGVEVPAERPWSGAVLRAAGATGSDQRAAPTTAGATALNHPAAGNAESDLAAAATLLDSARRPLLWVGGGALDAGPAIARLAERLAAPVITTYQARGLLGNDHPLAVGLPPHLPACGALWDAADVVLAIGTDFDAMMTQNWLQPAPPTLITLNLDPADAAKAYPPALLVTGDAALLTPALADAVTDRGKTARSHTAADLAQRRTVARAHLGAENPDAMRFLAVLDDLLPAEAVVVADMCIPGYWYAALGRVAGPRRLAYPVGWGTLGFSFPASLGTAAAAALHGLGPVVCLCGDGGFLFAAGELATLAQEQLPVTVILVDDGGYGMLRFDQQQAGTTSFGVDLLTPDFAALAVACGVSAETVDGVGADFAAALERQLADPAPTLLVVRVALDPPPTTSPRWYRRGGG